MATASNSSEQEPTVAIARVLIVEDEVAIARATERLIRRVATTAVEVVHVVTAESAITALACASERPFDLVVSDFNLAGIQNGGDVLAFVRSMQTKAPKFLFLSSDPAIEECGVAYLTKPASPSELREVIGEAPRVA